MNHEMKPCLISCGILKEEIEKLVEEGSLDIDLCFLEAGLHYDYDRLEKVLTAAVEKRLKNYPKGIIILYGDVCLGFNYEMKELVHKYGLIKVDALNCIDCLLGGKSSLLKIDPEHKYLFLTPAWIDFWNRFEKDSKEDLKKRYGSLKGIILLDSFGNLDDHTTEIEEISDKTGLSIIEKKHIGSDGLKEVITEAINQLPPQKVVT